VPSLVAARRAMKTLGDGASIGRCALCGRSVLATDRYLRVRGLIFHQRCAAYRRRRLVSLYGQAGLSPSKSELASARR
jgi:recombinational DNA repair protein (RecF pathway)